MKGVGHGQVWWADLDKIRPVLILTRGRIASRLSRVVVAPVTTVSRDIPTEVNLGPAEGLSEGSVANFDNIQLLEVDRLLGLAGKVSSQRWPEFCAAMSKMMAC